MPSALAALADINVIVVGAIVTEPVNNFSFIALETSDSNVGVNPSILILRLLPSPTIIPGASTSSATSFPRLVKDESTILGAKVLPVSVSAGTGNVISTVPLKGTVLIKRVVSNLTARLETPENVPPSIVSTTILLNVLVPVTAVTLPCTSPNKSALTEVAEKPPTEFLATTVPIKFSELALMSHVVSNAPLNSDPTIKSPAFKG